MSEHSAIQSEAEARSYVEKWAGDRAMDRLHRFAEILIDENQKQNLISKPSEAQIWQRHIADSAQLLEFVSRETLERPLQQHWLDLGTGAGFPGIVIAALCPEMPVTLVESRKRRVDFLQGAIDDLGLKRCSVIGERLEQVSPFPVTVISARAFAPLEKLLRLSSPFSTKATRYVLPKGRSAAQELNEQKKAIRKMFHVEQSLTDSQSGIIVSS